MIILFGCVAAGLGGRGSGRKSTDWGGTSCGWLPSSAGCRITVFVHNHLLFSSIIVKI